MAKTDEEARRPLPPYIPFKTLTGLVQRLKETVVPNRIDLSLLRNYSGAVARQLIAALKFLKLIEEGGTTTERLGKLVKVYDTPEWAEAWGEAFDEAYTDVLRGLDVQTMTPAELDAAFRNYGADGDVLRKCVGFWIAGTISANWTIISPHILNRPRAKPTRTATRQRREKASEPKGQELRGDEIEQPAAEPGTVRFSFPIPGKAAVTMFLPEDFSQADWEMVSVMMKAYIARKEQGE